MNNLSFSEFYSQQKKLDTTFSTQYNNPIIRQQSIQNKLPVPPPQRKVVRETVVPRNSVDEYKYIEQNINKEQPKIERAPTKRSKMNVVIDSRDRNRTFYPGSNKFMVQINPTDQYDGAAINTQLKNVDSINLTDCIVPNFTGNHPYLTLIIPELQQTISGTNDKLRKAFAILIPDKVNGDFVTCKTKDNNICLKKFNPPLASISHLTLEFYTPAGDLYDFGADSSPPTAPVETVQTMAVMEICTIITDNSILESNIIH